MGKCPKALCVREQTRPSIDRHTDAATSLKWAGLSHWAHLSTWAPTWVQLKANAQCSCEGKLPDQQLLQNPFPGALPALGAQNLLCRYPNLPTPLISASLITQRAPPGLVVQIGDTYDVCHSSTGHRMKIQRGFWLGWVCKDLTCSCSITCTQEDSLRFLFHFWAHKENLTH